MQPLTASPRDQLTTAQVSALLTGPTMSVTYGVELLDAALNFQGDISGDVSLTTISRDCAAAVHGSIRMSIDRNMTWGYDRVRPYMTIWDGLALTARFNLGVYLLTSPSLPLGAKAAKRSQNRQGKALTRGVTWTVTGYDQLQLLQNPIGDSYSVPAGTNVLTAIQNAITAAQIVAPVLLDQTANAMTLPVAKTWPLTSSTAPQWINVVSDLLASIGYAPLWVDWNGAFRAVPFIPANVRPVEWVFSVGDLNVGIIEPNRQVSNDVWSAPNWWRFIQNGLTAKPVEGVSQYTVNNVNVGPACQNTVRRVVRASPQFFDAVNYASLKTQGDAVIAAAMQATEVINATMSPFPLAWHLDIAMYSDPDLGSPRTVQGTSWQLPCDGTQMTYVCQTVT